LFVVGDLHAIDLAVRMNPAPLSAITTGAAIEDADARES
jgi:hypothetical protein